MLRNLLLALATLLLALATLAAAGCAAPEAYRPRVPYTAVEARLDGSTLQIRYLSPDGLLYSESPWPAELRDAGGDRTGKVAVFLVTPHATGREPLSGRLSGRRLRVLGPEEYRNVRDALIAAAVPREAHSGIAVRMRGEEITLYFDENGRFHSTIGPPPPGVGLVASLPLEDYLSAGPATLATMLERHGIREREVVFNTGDTGANALPFLYANLDTATAAYVGVRPAGASAEANGSPIVPLTQSVVHIVTSHTVGLLNRPVSSVFRVIFMVGDAVRDSFDVAWTLDLEGDEVPPVGDLPGMDLAAWEAHVDEMIGRRSRTGDASYLVGGDAFFLRLEQAVDEARESILVRTYIFDNDDYALRFADRLRARAADGVDVRVLMDGLGTLSAGTQPSAGQPDDHEAPASIRSYLEQDSQLDVRTVLNPFFTGDHTKTIIVDGTVAFIGGMNIGREYRYEWHDMMAEVHGPVVAEIADDFDKAWAGAGFMGDLREFLLRLAPRRDPGPPGDYPVRVLYTRPLVSEIRKVQLAAIARAQSYIYLQNAYLTDDTFLHALVRARQRGVDVRVIVPWQSDRGILQRDNILAANVMFRNGIRVYIYPGMSHIKAAVYDGWACLGSANVDQLSLRVNREVNIATSAPEAVQPLLDAVFEADFRASPEMQQEFPAYWFDVLWEMVGDYLF